ncbi:hypothetical protein SDJN02_12252, partial [Cucurbita argyrosperma subsp. argyrosperma]
MEEGFNLCILISISFQFLLPTSGILNKSNELVSYSARGTAVCSVINCGQGACKASNASFLGFDMRAVLVAGLFGVVMEPAWPIEQLCSYTLATAAKASGIY